MQTKNYDELLNQQKNYMIANQDKITDFNPGSTIMTIFEAIARIVERFYIETRNGYAMNLKALAYAVFDFKKKEGTYAQAKVVFSRAEPLSSDTVINAGTLLTSGSYEFETTETAIVKNGEIKSNSVSVRARKVGTASNVGADTINSIESLVSDDIVSVTNEKKAYGGSDEESDTEMFARFKTYINGLQGGSKYAVKSSVLNIPEVRSVTIEEHKPLKNGVFNATVYVDDGTGNMTKELYYKVYDTINGNDTSTNPGSKSAGINIDIQNPVQLPITVSATIYTYRTEEAIARKDIEEALKNLINSMKIGDDLLLTDVIMKLRGISYVKDIKNLVLSTTEQNAANDNINVGINQIARFNIANLNFVSV